MSAQPDLRLQPPRIAQWLVELFMPADLAESTVGDLLEEFSALRNSSGPASAKRWYWGQALSTILDAGANAFRAAHLLMLIIVVGGLWAIGSATGYSSHAMQRFLDAHAIYRKDPNAYLFWFRFPLLAGRVMLCAAIGVLTALVARRKEMIAVSTLASAQMMLFVCAVVLNIACGRGWFGWFLDMLRWNTLDALAIVLGGLIVRKSKPSASFVKS